MNTDHNAAMVGVGPHKSWEQAHNEAMQAIYVLAQQIEAITAERDSLKEAYDNFLKEIWEIVDDGTGDWEYPGQIIRAVEEKVGQRKSAAVGEPDCEQCHGSGCSFCDDDIYEREQQAGRADSAKKQNGLLWDTPASEF